LSVNALYKNLGRVRIWGHSPWVRTHKNVALGYNIGKISAGCLVSKYDNNNQKNKKSFKVFLGDIMPASK